MWVLRFFGASKAVEVTGSLKFDGIVRDRHTPAARQLRAALGFSESDRILVAGSTHFPEEEWVVTVVQKLAREFPRLKLVVVPRHPRRSKQIALKLERMGTCVVCCNHLHPPGRTPHSIVLLETMGVLRDVWSIADFAFVGGSLTPHGGHNMAEPGSFGLPMCYGPHVANFQQMADQFLAAGAAAQLHSTADLEVCLRVWLNDPEKATRLGLAARQVVADQTHPLEATVRGVLSVLPPPSEVPASTPISAAAS
jgi:3-deoxy-D-manno-octulosonic-acid transferase